MNVIDQARHAYAPTQAPIRTERAIEAQLIGQITARLKRAAVDPSKNFPELADALLENRRMWTTLAVSVADTDNTLPPALRAQIFYLAEFTEQHSQKILRRSGETDVLIEINTAILRGLNSQGVR